jgi:hypothetical protein
MKAPLEEIAWAALDVEDLARGVIGTVEVEGLESVRRAQTIFLAEGWKRQEKHEGWSKLEHRVYSRGKKGGKRVWLKITVGNFMGVFGQFETTKREPY